MEFEALLWLLREWGAWHSRVNAYPDHASIENFRLGAGGGIPGSRPPRGCEIPARLEPVIRAFLGLQEARGRAGDSLAAVRLYYTTGWGDARCAASTGLSAARFRQLRNLGENLLYGWMLADDDSSART